MKALKAHIVTIALLLAACLATGASSQTLRDANYHNMGRISPNGVVRGANSQSIGFFDSDGTVRDSNNKAIGKIKAMQIYDNSGTRIGYVNTDGTVHDGESRTLGKIDRNGKVTDASQKVIGYAQGVKYEWIACYYFFFFQ